MNVRQLVDAIAALDEKDALQCRLGLEAVEIARPLPFNSFFATRHGLDPRRGQ